MPAFIPTFTRTPIMSAFGFDEKARKTKGRHHGDDLPVSMPLPQARVVGSKPNNPEWRTRDYGADYRPGSQ